MSHSINIKSRLLPSLKLSFSDNNIAKEGLASCFATFVTWHWSRWNQEPFETSSHENQKIDLRLHLLSSVITIQKAQVLWRCSGEYFNQFLWEKATLWITLRFWNSSSSEKKCLSYIDMIPWIGLRCALYSDWRINLVEVRYLLFYVDSSLKSHLLSMLKSKHLS